MATSSITRNFVISGHAVERFVNALDAAWRDKEHSADNVCKIGESTPKAIDATTNDIEFLCELRKRMQSDQWAPIITKIVQDAHMPQPSNEEVGIDLTDLWLIRTVRRHRSSGKDARTIAGLTETKQETVEKIIATIENLPTKSSAEEIHKAMHGTVSTKEGECEMREEYNFDAMAARPNPYAAMLRKGDSDIAGG